MGEVKEAVARGHADTIGRMQFTRAAKYLGVLRLLARSAAVAEVWQGGAGPEAYHESLLPTVTLKLPPPVQNIVVHVNEKTTLFFSMS